jgi:hypothetical protein
MDILDETADLNEFLFVSERSAPAEVRLVLMDIQRGCCFYCGLQLKPGNTEVDHFVAWSRYPQDLGHNFVLADIRCNGKKVIGWPRAVILRHGRNGTTSTVNKSGRRWTSAGPCPNSRHRTGWLIGHTHRQKQPAGSPGSGAMRWWLWDAGVAESAEID